MKMARASQVDMDAAVEVTRLIGDLENRYMPDIDPDKPSDETEHFDRDDAEQCKRALAMLLDAAAKGSLFRVVFGMLVVLDPRNELLDPDASTLEQHPKTLAALAAVPELRCALTIIGRYIEPTATDAAAMQKVASAAIAKTEGVAA